MNLIGTQTKNVIKDDNPIEGFRLLKEAAKVTKIMNPSQN